MTGDPAGSALVCSPSVTAALNIGDEIEPQDRNTLELSRCVSGYYHVGTGTSIALSSYLRVPPIVLKVVRYAEYPLQLPMGRIVRMALVVQGSNSTEHA